MLIDLGVSGFRGGKGGESSAKLGGGAVHPVRSGLRGVAMNLILERDTFFFPSHIHVLLQAYRREAQMPKTIR